MTREELITAVHKRLETLGEDVSKRMVKDVVLEFVFTAVEALLDEKDVRIDGFGKFHVKTRASRQGRNPRTGEEIDIPEMRYVKFTPSSTLKKALNN